MDTIKIDNSEEKALRAGLKNGTDADALRLKRFLSMPDLTRTPESPIKELVEHIVDTKVLSGLDHIEVPEIVPADVAFDLFNFPADHPGRSRSDTYYVDDKHILRTHTTVMWYYYLMLPEVKERIARGEDVGSISWGKVYRKDEVDRFHMNVFHQIDGWYLTPKSKKVIGMEDLENVLAEIARSLYGEDIKYRFNEDKFPFTHPSTEMEVELDGKWIEILGAGIVHPNVLKSLNVDPDIYNGWAFGMGLERLAIASMELPDIRLLWSEDERVKKQLKLGQKYKEVSKFPPVLRDISFIVKKDFVPNDYFDSIRDIGGDTIEQIELIDKYENDNKFGADRMSYTYRITYRDLAKTLTNEEVNALHSKIEEATEKEYGAEIRRV
jgi:phenylalanyl-tRNA synthetase alpha chain